VLVPEEDDDDDDVPLEGDDPVNGLTADAISCSLRLFPPGNAVFQFFDPTGPLRLVLPRLALLLLRTAGIRLGIASLRSAGAGTGLEDGAGLRRGPTGAPRFSSISSFLETAHQFG
jgi:hypothetical protein